MRVTADAIAGHSHSEVLVSTVILIGADRFPRFRLLPALRVHVHRAGLTCSTQMMGDRLEVTIHGDPHTASKVADGVVDWYFRWRRSRRT